MTMTRFIVSSFVLFASFLFGPAPVLFGQAVPLGTSVQVRIVDAYSGVPVVGAPVQVIGHPYLQTTDSEGWARFMGLPLSIGSLVRVWTTPPTHAPASREWLITTLDNWIILHVPPKSAALSTALIDPQQGGSYVLSSVLPTPSPTPVEFEVDVPPGAFPVPVKIHILPYPAHAFFFHGFDPSAYMVGMVHVSVTDANGRPRSETLAAPVTIRGRPYAADYGGLFEQVLNVSTLHFSTYDYVLHEWVPNPTAVSYNPATGLVEYTTMHFSITSCGGEPQQVQGEPPPPPPPSVDFKWTLCTFRAAATVQCGIYTVAANCNVSGSTSLTFSAELSAKLEQNYGAQGGINALASISAQIGTQVSGTVGGTLTGTSSTTSGVSIAQGAAAQGGACFSGVDEIYELKKVYGVKMGSIELGFIEVPLGCDYDQTRIFDPGCCPNHGGGEGQTPIPPVPMYLRKKPSDCQE